MPPVVDKRFCFLIGLDAQYEDEDPSAGDIYYNRRGV